MKKNHLTRILTAAVCLVLIACIAFSAAGCMSRVPSGKPSLTNTTAKSTTAPEVQTEAPTVTASPTETSIETTAPTEAVTEAETSAPTEQTDAPEVPANPMQIVLTWNGKYDSGELMDVDIDLNCTFDDGNFAIITSADPSTYAAENFPAAHIEKSLSGETGMITVVFDRLDGIFELQAYVNGDPVDFYGLILNSGITAAATLPGADQAVNYTLDAGVYQSYTAAWFWAPFTVDHGTLAEYDASWIQTGGY